jgi:HEAT repeat protein
MDANLDSAENVVDLFTASLAGDPEDDAAWSAVKKLHSLGTREVFNKATDLTQSDDPFRRARGADILGQLGVQPGIASTSFVSERLHVLLSLLNGERNPIVINSAIIALGHLGEPEGIRAILPFGRHADENVRYAVAWALPTGLGNEPDVIATLMQLMQDSDSDVRDWATFGLGTQSRADSEAIRDALIDRLSDTDEDTRAEAAVGLAKRKDLRVIPVVLEELDRDEYGVLYEEAASHLLGLDDVKPKDWESWRYIEELRARFNIQEQANTHLH